MTTIFRSNLAIIVAGTKDQARECAIRRGLKPHQWVYCGNPMVFRGRLSPPVITAGTWTTRPDLAAIEFEMKAAKVRPEDVTNDRD